VIDKAVRVFFANEDCPAWGRATTRGSERISTSVWCGSPEAAGLPQDITYELVPHRVARLLRQYADGLLLTPVEREEIDRYCRFGLIPPPAKKPTAAEIRKMPFAQQQGALVEHYGGLVIRPQDAFIAGLPVADIADYMAKTGCFGWTVSLALEPGGLRHALAAALYVVEQQEKREGVKPC
jgi:hypothetical protein